MIIIDKVGLELELADRSVNYHRVSQFHGVPVAKHRNAPIYNKRVPSIDAVFGMTQEYYENQIEFNIGWDNTNLCNVKSIYKWIYKHMKDGLVTYHTPSYVGTHIHFLLKVGTTPVEFRLRRKKYIVFLTLLKYYNRLFPKLLASVTDNNLLYSFTEDIERLIANHNINIYRDSKYFSGNLGKIRRELTGLRYHYTNGRDKPKYQPMLWANPTNDKPLSFEVRRIPNTVALNPIRLKSVINKVQIALNTKGSKIINIKSEIEKERVMLCKLHTRGAKKLNAIKVPNEIGPATLKQYYKGIESLGSN